MNRTSDWPAFTVLAHSAPTVKSWTLPKLVPYQVLGNAPLQASEKLSLSLSRREKDWPSVSCDILIQVLEREILGLRIVREVMPKIIVFVRWSERIIITVLSINAMNQLRISFIENTSFLSLKWSFSSRTEKVKRTVLSFATHNTNYK